MSTRRALQKSGYKNKSKYFLPLMLNLKMYDKKHLIDVNFIQRGFPQVVLIFDNSDSQLLKEDIHRISMSPYFVTAEYGDDDKEVAVFFDVPNDQRDNFELFVKGKYSKFSKKFKEKVVKEYGMYREEGVNDKGLPKVSPYDVVSPSDELLAKFQEYLDIDMEIEEVLDAPSLKEEEFKEIEELIKEKQLK